ncbi:hypothetical protein AS006_03565 [Thermotoga sp. SG1]|nr:hypothetical protein AS006_03565 [Thermotoga sp. SG1]
MIDTVEKTGERVLNKILILSLGIPVVFSLIRAKIVETVGYFIFWLGGFSPYVYEKVVHQEVPEKTKLMLSSSIFLHSVLGQFMNFYGKIPFWDKCLHFYGSFVVTYFFYQILTRKSRYWDEVPGAILMAFLLSTLSGLLWEIAEFVTDKVVPGYNTQKGLDDTMLDLIFDLLGSYVMAKILYKKKTGHVFWRPRP